MAAKIKAAVDARHDADFIVIARTDAIAVEGFEAAIGRAQTYGEAGADVLFVEAPVHMSSSKLSLKPSLAPLSITWPQAVKPRCCPRLTLKS